MRWPGRRGSVPAAAAGLVLAGVAALFLLGGDDERTGGPADAPALSEDEALVFGRVLDTRSKRPIAGARVIVKQRGEPVTARTDRRGGFRVVVTTREPFAFETQATGYMGTAAGAVGGLCGRQRFELNLSLLPAGAREPPPAPLFLSGKCPVGSPGVGAGGGAR